MSRCTAKLRGRKGKWGRARSGNLARKEETRAPSQLQNYLTRNFSAFLLLPQNLLGNVKHICSCCRKGWKEGVIWVNNSAGGSRVLKEELRFLQKLFGKTVPLKIFCWCERIPISSMYRGRRCWKKKKKKTTFEHLTGFSLCFLRPVSNKLQLESIEICFSPNAIKTE